MDSRKYNGMDVHQASISIAVRDADGKLVMESLQELFGFVKEKLSANHYRRLSAIQRLAESRLACSSAAAGSAHFP